MAQKDRRMFESPLHDCDVYYNDRVWTYYKSAFPVPKYRTRFVVWGPRSGWPMREVWKDHRLATNPNWGVWDLMKDDKISENMTWFEACEQADQMDLAWLAHSAEAD